MELELALELVAPPIRASNAWSNQRARAAALSGAVYSSPAELALSGSCSMRSRMASRTWR